MAKAPTNVKHGCALHYASPEFRNGHYKKAESEQMLLVIACHKSTVVELRLLRIVPFNQNRPFQSPAITRGRDCTMYNCISAYF